MRGTAGDDVLNGFDGDDTLFSSGGADAYNGGDGIDRVVYSLAESGVTINLRTGETAGAAAGDTYTGIENVFGSAFNDTITSASTFFTSNRLYGQDGDDTLTGSFGIDFLYGGDGNDTLNGVRGNNILNGGMGDDTLNGGVNNDTFIFSSGADTMNGGGGTDRAVYSLSQGGVIVDLDNGGTGGDANGDTYISVEDVFGSAFNDTIIGNALDNRLYGQDGDDILEGGAGLDLFDGGDGNDTASYTSSQTGIEVDLAEGGEFVGPRPIDRYVSIENVSGSAFDDVIAGDTNVNNLYGQGGNDELRGGLGNDSLFGGTGDDTLRFSTGQDVMDGGEGMDRVVYTLARDGVVIDLVNGGLGGAATGDSYIDIENAFGSRFNDTILGDTGTNRLYGQSGDDTLDGRSGDDFFYGGAGDDVFLFSDGDHGYDRIVDFQDGVDIIRYDNIDGVDDFSDLTLIQVEDVVSITINGSANSGQILLLGVDLADITAADFEFTSPMSSEKPASEPVASEWLNDHLIDESGSLAGASAQADSGVEGIDYVSQDAGLYRGDFTDLVSLLSAETDDFG